MDRDTEAPIPSPLTCDRDLHPPTPSLNLLLRPSLRFFTVASVSDKPRFLPPARIGVSITEERMIVTSQRKVQFKPSVPSTIAIAAASMNPEYSSSTTAVRGSSGIQPSPMAGPTRNRRKHMP